MKKVITRKKDVVNQLVQGIKYLLDQNKVKVINGTGEILDKETVYVKNGNSETFINSKNIIIATGSKISKLPIPGLDLKNVINSDQALELNELPKQLVIIGGGVIGMEFAFIYANFGVDVTIIEYVNEVLAACDSDICHEINQIAESKGIKIYTGSKVEEIIKSENDQCIVAFNLNGERKYVTTDKVLVAVGREPSMDGINVEKLGIELNENARGIKVNDNMQTNIPNIYAIGDVTNRVLLAHVASHQGMVAVKNIFGEDCKMDYSAVPSVIFTDPEIAIVGIGEKQATNQGLEFKVGMFPFAANGKALTMGENAGFIKLISDKTTNKIIGGSIIGPHATDLIAEVTLAVKNQLTAEDIIETIHAHPTTAEVAHEAALALKAVQFTLFNNKPDTKIIRSLSFDPWYNLALEEHLLHHVCENQIILYLWQNDNTVVICRNQNAWKECRWKQLENDGGKLARRLSGGGAVFHDLGNLNFTFIMDKKLYNLEKQLQVILDAVKKSGIGAEFTGRNDLTVQGKKFSGNAFYSENNAAYHHGTLLINSDFQKLLQYLQVSKEKISSKGIDSVQSRVLNLSSIESSITIETMIQNLEESFIKHYGGQIDEINVDQFTDEINRLYQNYSSWEWRYGETPNFDISFEKRFPWGGIELGFSLENGSIVSAFAYSDAMDYEIIQKVSATLKDCPFQIDDMIERIDSIPISSEEEIIISDLKSWLRTKSI